MTKNTGYVGMPCRRMRPTKKHRPAIWENMLGTVYAMNEGREVRYFDYDFDEAKKFAGVVDGARDPRVWRVTQDLEQLARCKHDDPYDDKSPSRRKLVFWILKEEP